MKRRLVVLLLLLVGGAIVNVAVAWGCAALAPLNATPWGSNGAEANTEPADHSWLESANWCMPDTRRGERMFRIYQTEGVGVHVVELSYFHTTPGGLDMVKVDDIFAATTRAGWPLKALVGGRLRRNGITLEPYEMIDAVELRKRGASMVSPDGPLRPIWPGFAINTVFYAAILWLLFAGPFVVRRWRRIRRSLCPKCAYDLRGTRRGQDARACPECGAARPTVGV